MTVNDKICVYCQHGNSYDASTCAHCGERLSDDTTIMAAGEILLDVERPPIDIDEQIDEDVLYFYVASSKYNDPLLHRGRSSIVLGRKSDEADDDEFLDLSGYQAYSLGVSRQHVRIHYQNSESYMVEDLGSSNGTWLNGNRLEANKPHALHRGDHVQLGELMIFVYFFHGSQA